jgi:hypothetical protein
MRTKKLFWWTLGIAVVILVVLVLLAGSGSDSPFSYAVQ